MRNNKGITLIALVITIIVLLILAGITIAMLTGENGILNNATKSKAYNELGTAKDQVGLKVSEAISDYFNNVYVKTKPATADPDNPNQGTGNYSETDAQDVAIEAVAGMTLPAGVSFVKESGETNVADNGTFVLQYGDYTVQGNIGVNGSLTWQDIVDTRAN